MPLSLKWRIQLWHALILGIVLTALGTGFYFYEKHQQLNELDQWLDQQIPPIIGSPRQGSFGPQPLPGQYGPPPGQYGPLPGDDEPPPNPLVSSDFRPEFDAAPAGWNAISRKLPTIVGSDVEMSGDPGNYQAKFEQYYVPLGFYAIVENHQYPDRSFHTSNAPDIELPRTERPGYFARYRDGRYREIVHPTLRSTILIGADLSHFQASLHALKLKIIGASLVIFMAGIGIGYLLVSHSLLPLKSIEETSEKIASGNLHERIADTEQGPAAELQALATHLNKTFAQLESLFNRQIRFTADASHELRTPLTALLAQIEHGRNRKCTYEELVHILDVCSRSAERIRRITEQLIELSRYDSKRVELDYEELPLDGFLLSLAEELECYVRNNGCKLKTELGEGVLCCDPFRLHQVITNLINNALQHNHQPITITLRARNEGEKTIIQVIDNGQGIQPENLNRLFDRFFQESASRTKRPGQPNVGLGLAIAQAMIRAHGGGITATSQPGIETAFTITIPANPMNAFDAS